MANVTNYGWAYVHPTLGQAQARGVDKSIQFLTGAVDSNGIGQGSGSANLLFDYDTNTIELVGNMTASGHVSASYFFGDGNGLTNLNIFPYTGDAEIIGSLSVTVDITGSTIKGTTTVTGSKLESAGDISGSDLYVSNHITASSLEVSGEITGSDLMITNKITGSTLEMSGDITGSALNISGDISAVNISATNITASNYVIENVTEISSDGNSKFGDHTTDNHIFSGTLDVNSDGTNKITGSLDINGSTVFGKDLANHTHQFTGSVSFNSNTLETNGSTTFGDNGSDTHEFTGSFAASGSTSFGKLDSDTHQFTGSVSFGASGGSAGLEYNVNNSQTRVTGFRVAYRSENSTSFTGSVSDYIIGIASSHTTAVSVELPSAATVGAGALLIIKDEATGGARSSGDAITVQAPTNQHVDGAASVQIAGTMASKTFYSDGTNKWFVI